MDKEVRFTEKKVDQSWKEDIAKEKGKSSPEPAPQTGISFAAFLSSLGYQALIHLGAIPHPETKDLQIDIEAAKETIDLLVLLESKTKGNRTPEEETLLKNLLAELQIKFVEKVR